MGFFLNNFWHTKIIWAPLALSSGYCCGIKKNMLMKICDFVTKYSAEIMQRILDMASPGRY